MFSLLSATCLACLVQRDLQSNRRGNPQLASFGGSASGDARLPSSHLTSDLEAVEGTYEMGLALGCTSWLDGAPCCLVSGL